jgi:hypothetical protein
MLSSILKTSDCNLNNKNVHIYENLVECINNIFDKKLNFHTQLYKLHLQKLEDIIQEKELQIKIVSIMKVNKKSAIDKPSPDVSLNKSINDDPNCDKNTVSDLNINHLIPNHIESSNFGLDDQEVIWDRINKARSNHDNNLFNDVADTSIHYNSTSCSLSNIDSSNNACDIIINESSRVNNLDVSGLDVSGLDVSGLDVSGLDVSSLDVSSLDVSSLDVSSLDVSSLDVSELNTPDKYPTINALHKLNTSDRIKCIREIFRTASNNVKEMGKLDIKYINNYALEVNKESDRLLETYLNTH